jgi:hypothetical protein
VPANVPEDEAVETADVFGIFDPPKSPNLPRPGVSGTIVGVDLKRSHALEILRLTARKMHLTKKLIPISRIRAVPT